MEYIYPAVYTPRKNGGCIVEVPDLPGCVTEGGDLQEAIHMAKDALAVFLCGLEDDGETIAPPSDPAAIAHKNGAFVSLIDVDLVQYRMETDNRAARNNVSVPAWPNARAERAGVNFSQILQDGLKRQLGIV